MTTGSHRGGVGIPATESAGFPQYAYGLKQAAMLAKRLDVHAISALELGVAGGNGLVELERLGAGIGAEVGISIHVAGFDLGSGMPRPVDYRDMPYIWQAGFFRMDADKLRRQLTAAELIVGDIADTGRAFMARDIPPLGFISFDLDFYSSTKAAMEALLEHETRHYLPRVFCYFDDTVGPHEELHSEFTGELLAIAEFNQLHEARKLAPIHGLRYKLLPAEEPWHLGMHVLHFFDHHQYSTYVYPEADRQFPLDRVD